MPTENVGPAAGHANVTERELQDAACADDRVTNRVLGLAHAPHDGRRLVGREHFGQFVQTRFRHATGFFDFVRCPLCHHFGFDLVHPVDAIIDVLGVFPTVLENVMQHAEQERNIGARTNAHELIRSGCCASKTWIHHNQLGTGFFSVQHVQHRHRMRLSGVRPDVHRTLSVLHIVVRVGHRAVAPGVGHTGNRRRMTNTRLMVTIVGAEHAHKLAEHVRLLVIVLR